MLVGVRVGPDDTPEAHGVVDGSPEHVLGIPMVLAKVRMFPGLTDDPCAARLPMISTQARSEPGRLAGEYSVRSSLGYLSQVIPNWIWDILPSARPRGYTSR